MIAFRKPVPDAGLISEQKTEKLKGFNASLFNDAITHVVKTRRIFDAPEKSDMMLNRIKDEYTYRTSNDTNFINV